MIFYFSGTGNSKWIANQLSKEQKEDLVFIPDALRSGVWEFCLKEEETIGFVFPIYSWAPPEIVLSFIQKLSLKGYGGQYLFFVCSCGDDTGLTQQVLTKAFSHSRRWGDGINRSHFREHIRDMRCGLITITSDEFLLFSHN
jgi:flavodoxin